MIAGISLPDALSSRVHHSVCALSGLMRDPVSWHHWDTLSSCCCTASVASWESFDVLYMSPSSTSVRILLGSDLPSLWLDIEEDGESGDLCGMPFVSWWGPELQFRNCITTVLSRRSEISLTHGRANNNEQKQRSWSTLNLLGVLQANRKIQNTERRKDAGA